MSFLDEFKKGATLYSAAGNLIWQKRCYKSLDEKKEIEYLNHYGHENGRTIDSETYVFTKKDGYKIKQLRVFKKSDIVCRKSY